MKYILIGAIFVLFLTGCFVTDTVNDATNTTVKFVENETSVITKQTEDINAQFAGMMGSWQGLYDETCEKESKDTVIQWNNAKCYRCKDLNKSIVPSLLGPGEWMCP